MKRVEANQVKEFLPHILVVLTAATMWVLHAASPTFYEAAMQEDRFVEWLTFLLFLIAGCVGIYRGARSFRIFDFLVGVFCLFVAGEEISWGQRVIGFVPSETFLRSNYQQEVNVHNLASTFGQPKWTLIIVLLAYGVLLPAASRIRFLQPAYRALGATPPRDQFIPLFALLAIFLYWYPLPYTGEWVEMLSGALFLLTIMGGMSAWTLIVLATPLAMGASFSSTFRDADPESTACAKRETRALVDALIQDQALNPPVTRKFERRVWTAMTEGIVAESRLARFRKARCGINAARREQYAIDPWGTSYWLQVVRQNEVSRVTVYSFGPNRRRDEILETGDWSDDVAAHDVLPVYGGPVILP